jgi:MFS family permease
MWGLGALLYLTAYFHRVAPAVMTRELSIDFGLSAGSLGNLSAFYFYGYALVQVPTGLLADRWGPRRVLTVGAACAAAGALVFALATSVAWANAGRLVIGGAVGVAFVSMLKLASHWMPPRQFAFASGVALFVGVMGATLAGAPLRMLVEAFGWRPVMASTAAFSAMVTVLIALLVRDDPAERGYASFSPGAPHEASIAAQLREVARYRIAWLMLALPGGICAIILTFPGLWGVPFLVTQYGFTPHEAALACSAMLVTWAIACVAFGPLSERAGRRKPLYAGGLVAMLLLWAVVVCVPQLPRALLVALLVAVGIASGSFVITFALAKESVPAHLGGTISGIANMGVIVGGMIMQPLVGVLLDLGWQGQLENGVRVYDFAAWRNALAAMIAWGAVSLVLIAFIRETYCRPRGSSAAR